MQGLIRPVGHLLPFAALTGEGKTFEDYRLLPWHEVTWEKVADRPDEGLFEEFRGTRRSARNVIMREAALHFLCSVARLRQNRQLQHGCMLAPP